ncbi:SDR family oxidoreductase [Paraburkholderia phenoliruptrix]|uniref:SDR family oxidoreductase n=1 Tax=Paraburkholderia phenoliruptrix TaxID=252970 RepID=UPI001C4E46C8|nr:SDR family oxidoreductase [Paraburkholderia phenoliruptrix]
MGLATGRAFAQAGASVTLADVNADALNHAVDSLRVPAHQSLAVACDVTDEAQVAEMVSRTVGTSCWPQIVVRCLSEIQRALHERLYRRDSAES